MKALLVACLLAACHLPAEVYRPYHVLALSGTATLTRFGDEVWPLENDQELPGDFSLKLGAGAFIHFRVNKRVDLAVAGPAEFHSIVVERASGDLLQQDLALKLDHGEYLIDSRFLLGHASQLHLDLPHSNFELQAGTMTALSIDLTGTVRDAVASPALRQMALSPVPVLVLVRDYDKELHAWAHPAILGPTLVHALGTVPGMVLVEGSGDTVLAAHANNALRTGKDFFLQELGRERGARYVVMGNLVSEERHEDDLQHRAIIVASAEIRVLEAAIGGEAVVSDVATQVVPRKRRSFEIVDAEAMHAAADKVARYMVDDMHGLLLGQAHPPLLVKVRFLGLAVAWTHELRQGLGELPSVQRFFKRSFAAKVFGADVILRTGQDEFVRQLKAISFRDFTLKQDAEAPDQSLVFTLKKKPGLGPSEPSPPGENDAP